MAMQRKTDRMSDVSFRMMLFLFNVVDFFRPYIAKRVKKFGIKEGMTVVDYGCGPGRYTTKLAELVGESGKVYAIDIHELAIEAVRKKVEKHKLGNIQPVLAKGYDSTLPDGIADVVCAIDIFHGIGEPAEFLKELRRITKEGGTLVIDSGHQARSATKKKLLDSGAWDIVGETSDHLKCQPR